eukprot:gene55914-biopygen39898
MSGQTIEIINTDAEGRLVLADVLWYVKEKFKPKFMVDLATLTGAILVALGTEHAGLFSNNDELSERLYAVGQSTGEKVWRLPMGPEYDKMMDSQFADMKNAGARNGGSITAAQFLQRFVGDTPWAHLDIAGTGMQAQSTNVEVISNNIANMTTTGFKRRRAEFQDLIYQNLRRVGSNSSDAGSVVPAGAQVGLGVKTAAIYRINEQGNLQQTSNSFDMAIRGNGYFQITLPSGDTAYSRDGTFALSPERQIVTADRATAPS